MEINIKKHSILLSLLLLFSVGEAVNSHPAKTQKIQRRKDLIQEKQKSSRPESKTLRRKTQPKHRSLFNRIIRTITPNPKSNHKTLGLRRTAEPNPVCPIAPGLLGISPIIWTNKPVFLWRNKYLDKLQVLNDITGEIIWEKSLSGNQQFLVYDGPPLEDGQYYRWKIPSRSFLFLSGFPKNGIIFKVLDTESRKEITSNINGNFPFRHKLTPHQERDLALFKAKKFKDKGMWSDAISILYKTKYQSSEWWETLEEVTDKLTEKHCMAPRRF